MSNNVIVTRGHHTCEKCVNDAVVISRAPFKSVCDKKNRKEPFLGEGYYFWDDNISVAHWWGQTHYDGKYAIVEYDLTLKGDNFLDLIGSRQDNGILLTLKKSLEDRGWENLTVSKCIAALQILEKQKPGIFPYTIIRAMDVPHYQERMNFVDDQRRSGSMICDPRIIICYFDRNEVPLHTAKVVK